MGAGQTPGDTIGNGRATAIRFAQEGATVVCVDRDAASAGETLQMIEAEGGKGAVLEADVIRESACQEVISRSESLFDRIDVLHNNIGIGRGDSGITRMSEEVWDAIFATNLKIHHVSLQICHSGDAYTQ